MNQTSISNKFKFFQRSVDLLEKLNKSSSKTQRGKSLLLNNLNEFECINSVVVKYLF